MSRKTGMHAILTTPPVKFLVALFALIYAIDYLSGRTGDEVGRIN